MLKSTEEPSYQTEENLQPIKEEEDDDENKDNNEDDNANENLKDYSDKKKRERIWKSWHKIKRRKRFRWCEKNRNQTKE